MDTLKTLALAATFAVVTAAPASADDAAMRDVAKKTIASAGDAVVSVRLTVKTRMNYGGQERSGPEQTMEIAGTVIDASGLTAVSDFSSNPAGLFSNIPGAPTMDTETTDVKIVLKDGREVKARFVLRDQDLDLAFLVPTETATFAPVTLVKGAAPGVMDPVLFLYRMGRALGRELAVAPGEVRAVVAKPRTFLVTDFTDGLHALGCPAFDGQGRPIGLVVVRRSPTMPVSRGLQQILDMMTPVVLTSEDVLDLAAQAKVAAAKPVKPEPAQVSSPAPAPTPSPTPAP